MDKQSEVDSNELARYFGVPVAPGPSHVPLQRATPMKPVVRLLVPPISAFLLWSAASASGLQFFVSPKGSDTNPGTKARPFATLTRARDAIRAFRGTRPETPVTVYLRGGTYRLDTSFVLGPGDGGDSLAPVIYRGFAGEKVRLTGGQSLKGFRAVTDPAVLKRIDPACRRKVLQVDLLRNGFRDCGTLKARGFGRPITPAALELFFNDRAMTLARWPNAGWTTIGDTVTGMRDSVFVFAGDRPIRWTSSKDVWLHGYWTWDWADSYTKIDTIDVKRRLIVTRAPHGVYGYSKGKRFYALNILEELDAPGEFYVDRLSGILYFWPPAPLQGARVMASVAETPLIVMTGSAWVTLAHLTIECTRGAGVEIVGGHHNRLAGCTIRNIGTVGVSIGKLEPMLGSMIYDNPLYDNDGGRSNGVQSCNIMGCGEGGVILSGGQRASLTAGNNYVDNTHLTDCTRWVHTYRAGIFLWGVGNRVSNNLIHGLPHTAVFFWGNDHLLEYNEIYDVCRETGDAGAFYQGRDWTQRGNMIRYNYFHDLRGVQGQGGFTDVMAVYMDDFASGTTVSGNVFVNAGRSVMIGGGRDNLIENNLFFEGKPAVHVDARGRGWARFMIDGTNSTMYDRLKAIQQVRSLYDSRYPRLSTLPGDEPGLPKGNVIRQNISIGGIWRELLDGVNDSLVVFENNTVYQDSGFGSIQEKDSRLKDVAPVLESGLVRIPVERIGLYRDEYRLAVPPRRSLIPGGSGVWGGARPLRSRERIRDVD